MFDDFDDIMDEVDEITDDGRGRVTPEEENSGAWDTGKKENIWRSADPADPAQNGVWDSGQPSGQNDSGGWDADEEEEIDMDAGWDSSDDDDELSCGDDGGCDSCGDPLCAPDANSEEPKDDPEPEELCNDIADPNEKQPNQEPVAPPEEAGMFDDIFG